MRRAIPLLLLLLSAPLLTGAGPTAPEVRPSFSAEQRADLDSISQYLNSMGAVQGGFSQIGPNGDVDQGKVYIDKPGKIRFDYEAPNPTLIVGDADSVYVQNRKLNTVDRYPLAGTPLQLILKNDTNLKQNRAILGIRRDGDSLIVDARTSNIRKKSNLSLVFAASPVELRQWTVIDDQGLSTTVALRNVHPVAGFPPNLFDHPEPSPAKK